MGARTHTFTASEYVKLAVLVLCGSRVLGATPQPHHSHTTARSFHVYCYNALTHPVEPVKPPDRRRMLQV